MKRLFPRVVPAALSLLGLLGFVSVNEGCSPNNDVKPGAPVLMALTIVENGSTNTSITADAIMCAVAVKGGGDCFVADNVIEGKKVDSADVTCQTTTSDWCRCIGDPTMSVKGTWDCDAFSPTSMVYATFDRLLDTTPLDPGDAGTRDDIATFKSTPATPTPVTTSTSYSSTGAPTYFLFGGGPNLLGPSLTIQAMPAMPAGTMVTLTLDKTKVLAKDGKTPFMGKGPLVDGTLTFNTAAFGVQIGVPTAPPPDASADAATEAGAEAGTDASAEAGAEAGTDAGADGGVVADASGSEVSAEAGASDAGTSDAGATSDAGTSDAAASDAAPSDAAMADVMTVTPPTPGAPVPADMNMAPVTLTFNNTIDTNEADGDFIQKHLFITENGAPFTAVTVDVSMAPKLTITPKTMWAAGKTYVVTVDATAADVVGDTLKTPATAAFVMAN
jgi:Big-like domain-containing protein